MSKKILSVILMLVLTLGTCGVAAAADRGGATRSSLKSHGAIEYRKGNDKVVINSEDLYMLADQIDQVKLGVANQLGAMHTYFTAGDGISLDSDWQTSVTHTRPAVADRIDPMSVNFDTLLEGIAASQSVSSDVTAYGYSPGTKLYKSADGVLTTDGSAEGAEQISIVAATAENLSAGTAAWVNGRLILGTGGDNRAYFDRGGESVDTPGSTDTPSSADTGRGRVVNLRGLDNNQTAYLVPEDMRDVVLYFFATKKVTPVFETLPGSGDVACKELFHYAITPNGYVTHCYVYYTPEIKKGTTIKGFQDHSFLFTAEGSSKGNNISVINLQGYDDKQTTYSVPEDLKDVYLIRSGSYDAPSFDVLPGNPICAYKTLFTGLSYNRDKGAVIYIPEIKAGTVIKNFGTSYIVY